MSTDTSIDVLPMHGQAPDLPEVPFPAHLTVQDLERVVAEVEHAYQRVDAATERLSEILANEVRGISTSVLQDGDGDEPGGWLHTLHERHVRPFVGQGVLSSDWNRRWMKVYTAIAAFAEHHQAWSAVGARVEALLSRQLDDEEKYTYLVGNLGDAELKRREPPLSNTHR